MISGSTTAASKPAASATAASTTAASKPAASTTAAVLENVHESARRSEAKFRSAHRVLESNSVPNRVPNRVAKRVAKRVASVLSGKPSNPDKKKSFSTNQTSPNHVGQACRNPVEIRGKREIPRNSNFAGADSGRIPAILFLAKSGHGTSPERL
ncbi:hypothetical protein CAOG_08312 [Capsaspora owczarzaki ATCC 30864]|uniref:Uncharacterized protein n=1 Tax=Capsaspora owczarzaki (strain ATCC 30864) TaxID=595528 RepID=A0A0D2WYY2_CAPO3|nr:hypothetical protein CAOG_08312 [Capsaspora owczarzaki ATCC 30864]KJE98343.1 hypothetical protein CAOG_008312 [Capsaspora owczarzaki ATCC 30864]|eukprot:XP_004341485.1 hypothetical protein CAOG_08312 [Capsaspora owczarzaki ATCC 30864]